MWPIRLIMYFYEILIIISINYIYVLGVKNNIFRPLLNNKLNDRGVYFAKDHIWKVEKKIYVLKKKQ